MVGPHHPQVLRTGVLRRQLSEVPLHPLIANDFVFISFSHQHRRCDFVDVSESMLLHRDRCHDERGCDLIVAHIETVVPLPLLLELFAVFRCWHENLEVRRDLLNQFNLPH
jgi:hypothetical protein